MSVNQEAPGARNREDEPQLPSFLPTTSQLQRPSGKELTPINITSYDSNFPVSPVFADGGGLLEIANKLEAVFFDRPVPKLPGVLGGNTVESPPSNYFSNQTIGVPPQNREVWEVEHVNIYSNTRYQLPSCATELGSSGKETGQTGKETGAEASLAESWHRTLGEIATAWSSHAAQRRGQGLEPVWLEEALDQQLQAEVANGIRAGDLSRALTAINRWRQAWLELLAGAVPALSVEEERGWVEIDSAVLGGHVIVALTLSKVPEAKAARPDLVVYDPVEIDHLYGIKDGNLLRAVQAAKRELGAVVKDPRLADALIAESDGRTLHRNQGVHDMFAEARARFGHRDVEERCITSWLRKHAPQVAARWPDAPPTASLLDWRQRTGEEHVAVLDEAWRAALAEKKRTQP